MTVSNEIQHLEAYLARSEKRLQCIKRKNSIVKPYAEFGGRDARTEKAGKHGAGG